MATQTIYGLATGAIDNAYVGAIPAGAAPAAISAGVLFMCRKTPAALGALMTFPPNIALAIDSANNLVVTDISATTTLIPLGAYLDTWVLVTVSQSAGVLTVYVNGVLSAMIAVVTPIGAPTSLALTFDDDLDNVIAGGFWSGAALTKAQHQELADSTFATGSLSGARAIAQHVYLADRGMRPSALVWPDEGLLGAVPLTLAVGTTPLAGLITPGDFLVAGGSGGGVDPTPPQQDTTWYVASDPLGNDANDGLTPLTPFLTITHAESLIPIEVNANYRIIVLDAGTFALPNFRERVYANGYIYVNSDVDNTVLGATAAEVGSSQLAIDVTILAPAPGTYTGMFVEILTAADPLAVGDIRQIAYQNATTIYPVNAFSGAIALGDTYRIFEPSTALTLANGLGLLHGALAPASPLGLYLERFVFSGAGTLGVAATVAFYICKGPWSVFALDSQFGAGNDWFGATGPAAVYGVSTTTYKGAGITATSFVSYNNIAGFCVGLSDVVTVTGRCHILGGGFGNEFALGTGSFEGTRVFITPSAAPLFIVSSAAGLTLATNATCWALNMFIITTAAGQPGMRVNQGASLFCDSCIVTTVGAAAHAVEVFDGGSFETMPTGTFASAGGGSYGLLVQRGARAYCPGGFPMTGSVAGVNDLAVGNAPTLSGTAALAVQGDALLPGVVLDGSVIQRTL